MYAPLKKSTIWSTGLAIFSMFFGAGNIVFPLAIGLAAQDQTLWATCGMLLTAVLVPLAGVLAMLLFNGDYNAFFGRIGKWPGYFLILAIMGIIGPFGGIPRCIAISYATLEAFGLSRIPGMSLALFAALSCLVIFLVTFRQNRVLKILGYGLTPLLLISLGVIIVKSLLSPETASHSISTRWQTFSNGFLVGYNTLDLLASFFFSSGVLLCLKNNLPSEGVENKRLTQIAVWGSAIAATLLALVYTSFSFIAAKHAGALQGIASHKLLGQLTYMHLGPYAGIIAGLVAAFACLTTEIALALTLSEFVQKRLLKERVSYKSALIIVLGLSFLVATLHFEGISAFLVPIIEIFYPALIVLTLVNIAHKMFNFKPVKPIFYTAAAISSFLFFYLRSS